MVVFTEQLQLTKLELNFYAGSNLACRVWDLCDGNDLNLFVGQPFRKNNSSPLLLSFILLNEDIHALLCLKYYFVSKSTV